MESFLDDFEPEKEEPTKKPPSRKEMIFLFMIWLILYIFLIIPFLNNYFITHPEKIIYGFITNLLLIYGSLFTLTIFITHEVRLRGELSLWLSLGYFGLSLLSGPYCISPLAGDILLSETNYTCYFGNDVFVAALLNHLGVAFCPLMYVLVYFVVPAICIGASIYKSKDMWELLKINQLSGSND